MTQITQKDIAGALNISRETVTKAMLDHPKVSTKTKEIVTQKAADLGYIPNFFARNLSSGTSKIICFISLLHQT
jgi:LacI family transcriptional regulator